MTDPTLAAVGLTPAHEAAYELLIETASASASELDSRWALSDPLPPTLAALVDLGLATRDRDDPHRYRAVSPDVALGGLLLAGEQDLRATRRYVERLDATHLTSADVEQFAHAELVIGAEPARRQLEALTLTAREEIRCLATADLSLETLRPAGEPVGWRVICETEPLQQSPAATALRARDADVRVVPGLPAGVCLVDDRVAIIQVPPEGLGDHAFEAVLVVTAPALVRTIDAYFEVLWARAAPTDLGIDDERELIALLLAGGTDEVIARELDMGPRTLARRIAQLATQLGARNRFQMGVQAALRDARPMPQPGSSDCTP